MPSDLTLLGVPEFTQKLKGMVESLSTAETYSVFLTGAREIRDRARGEAPRRTGTLRKAIVARSAPRSKGREPAAFALVNLFRGANRAPHGHLVAFGTGERHPKQHKFLKITDARNFGLKQFVAGDAIYVKRARPVKANNFWERAVNGAGEPALQRAAGKVQAILQGASRK